MEDKELTLYSASFCSNCAPMKMWLTQRGVEFKVVDIDDEDAAVLDSYPIKALPTLVQGGKILGVGEQIKKYVMGNL